MRAGGLSDRIRLSRPDATVQDSVGQPIGDPVPLATVWGKLNPKGGRERFAASLELQEIDATILIRYRSDMDPSLPNVSDTRALVYGIDYDVTSVIDVMDGGDPFRGLLLACKAGVARSG